MEPLRFSFIFGDGDSFGVESDRDRDLEGDLLGDLEGDLEGVRTAKTRDEPAQLLLVGVIVASFAGIGLRDSAFGANLSLSMASIAERACPAPERCVSCSMLFERLSSGRMCLNAIKDDHHDSFKDETVMLRAVLGGSARFDCDVNCGGTTMRACRTASFPRLISGAHG